MAEQVEQNAMIEPVTPHLGAVVRGLRLTASPDRSTLGTIRAAIAEHLVLVFEDQSLTAAELRLVPMLATHLTFAEIGGRLSVSENTVKTQVMSVYRKLDATSRGEAVEHAVRAGLIDPAAVSAVVFGERY